MNSNEHVPVRLLLGELLPRTLWSVLRCSDRNSGAAHASSIAVHYSTISPLVSTSNPPSPGPSSARARRRPWAATGGGGSFPRWRGRRPMAIALVGGEWDCLISFSPRLLSPWLPGPASSSDRRCRSLPSSARLVSASTSGICRPLCIQLSCKELGASRNTLVLCRQTNNHSCRSREFNPSSAHPTSPSPGPSSARARRRPSAAAGDCGSFPRWRGRRPGGFRSR
jgi:hypothetical protein